MPCVSFSFVLHHTMPIIEISSLTDPGIDVYSSLTERQLQKRLDPMARYMPTSVHSPRKCVLRSLIISSSVPSLAMPIWCSVTNSSVASSASSLNLDLGAPQRGHFSGAYCLAMWFGTPKQTSKSVWRQKQARTPTRCALPAVRQR